MINNRMYLQIEWLHNAKFLRMKVCYSLMFIKNDFKCIRVYIRFVRI